MQAVIIKQIITRSNLHDMYWFEMPAAAEIKKPAFDFNDYSTKIGCDLQSIDESNWHKIISMKDQLRPDIKSMIDDELLTSTNIFVYLGYDPTTLVQEIQLSFENIEQCREANQKLFDAINPALVKLAKETNNKIRDEIYDEDGNFLEYGLFNIE